MKCSACGGPYHEATGHIWSERTRLCGPCAREWLTFLRGHVNRKWGKVRFYDFAATSIKAKP